MYLYQTLSLWDHSRKEQSYYSAHQREQQRNVLTAVLYDAWFQVLTNEGRWQSNFANTGLYMVFASEAMLKTFAQDTTQPSWISGFYILYVSDPVWSSWIDDE